MNNLKEVLFSFLLGGFICSIGQILLDKTKLSPAKILTAFVLAGVALGGIGVYEKLAEIGFSGAKIPLTGFGYAMVKGTRAAILEKGALGIITGPLSSASAGITVAVLCGLIASFITKPKAK